ncbi:PAS domain-containing protein [Rhodospirillaceae bacterium SYSU D60014]|uniref:PAS domain-containing protein n=1 Tax=Virgifigura deserti TaxID=2268457 RepID=UPI000E66426A
MGIEGIKSQKAVRLYEYWCSIKGARHMPARADIDPAEIKFILPNLLLTEMEAEPFRIRYRIVGTEVVRVTRVEFTNRYLDELASSVGDDLDLDYWMRQYRSCCEKREPIFGIGNLRYDGHWVQSFEWAILPLSTNGIDVDMAIAVEDYESRK